MAESRNDPEMFERFFGQEDPEELLQGEIVLLESEDGKRRYEVELAPGSSIFSFLDEGEKIFSFEIPDLVMERLIEALLQEGKAELIFNAFKTTGSEVPF